MSDIAPISSGVSRLSEGGHSPDARPVPGRSDGASRPSDRVELSDRARYLSRLSQPSPVREDLVQRVRGEIEGGQYETPERIEGVLDALSDDLDLMA
jgi:Anti-sigma-28 factor, FlgM